MNRRGTVKRVATFIGVLPMLACADDSMISNYHLMESMNQLAHIISTFSIIMGLGLLFAAIFKFKRYGEMRTFMSHQMTIAKPMMMMLGAVALLSLPVFLRTVLIAFWSTDSPLTYHAQSGTDQLLIPPLIMFVRLVGVGSFIRGVVLLSRTGGEQSQPGLFAKGLLHLLGGVLCVHVLGLTHLIKGIFDLS